MYREKEEKGKGGKEENGKKGTRERGKGKTRKRMSRFWITSLHLNYLPRYLDN
jgi:hypothetical protein